MNNAPTSPGTWADRKSRLHYTWMRPLQWAEWASEWIVYGLSRWAFLQILDYVGRFSILIAVVLYFAGADERVKERHYQAWQVVNVAQGKGGSGGRIAALEDLNRDRVSLDGVDLSKAWLPRIRLPKASLREASFRSANLTAAHLEKANLEGADLRDAELEAAHLDEGKLRGARMDEADLRGAILRGADLTRARLKQAKLSEASLAEALLERANLFKAKLSRAVLTKTVLRKANLQFCELREARLEDAVLTGARLDGADLKEAVLDGADLRRCSLSEIQNWRQIKGMRRANIHGVKDAPPGFVQWATSTMGAVSEASDEAWQEMKGRDGESEQDATAEPEGIVEGSGQA